MRNDRRSFCLFRSAVLVLRKAMSDIERSVSALFRRMSGMVSCRSEFEEQTQVQHAPCKVVGHGILGVGDVGDPVV